MLLKGTEYETTKVIGDPIEIAALKGCEWKYNAKTQVSTPGIMEETEKALNILKDELTKLKPEDPAAKKVNDLLYTYLLYLSIIPIYY